MALLEAMVIVDTPCWHIDIKGLRAALNCSCGLADWPNWSLALCHTSLSRMKFIHGFQDWVCFSVNF